MNKKKAYTALQVILKSIGTIGRVFNPSFGAVLAVAEFMNLKNLPETKGKLLKKVMEKTVKQTREHLALSESRLKMIEDTGSRLEILINSASFIHLSNDALDCSFLSNKIINSELTPKDLREILAEFMAYLYSNISTYPELCNFLE